MWTALVLNSSVDCKSICNKIQKDIVERSKRQGISIEGKLLRIEIRDIPSESKNLEKLNIPES